MSRFIDLGAEIVNVDKIIRVMKGRDGLSIVLEDDHRIDIDRSTIKNLDYIGELIYGSRHIVQVFEPTEELYTLYAISDDLSGTELYQATKVKLLAVLANGQIEAVELCDGSYETCVECSNYYGIYTKEQALERFGDVDFY